MFRTRAGTFRTRLSSDIHTQAGFRTIAPELQISLRTGAEIRHAARQVTRVAHGLAIQRRHHIAGLEAGLGGGAVIFHTCHKGTLRGFSALGRQLQRRRHGRIHGLGRNTKEAALHLAFLTQFQHNALHHVGRHGKADTNRTTGRAEDRRIHADHAAIAGEKWAAGIALIDRRIHLDEIIIGASANIAASCRDHTRGHGAGQAIGIAHGHHPIAGLGTIRITQGHEGQRRAGFNL